MSFREAQGLTGFGEAVDEQTNEFLHDGICRVVVVEFQKVIMGFEGDHIEFLLCQKRRNPRRGGHGGRESVLFRLSYKVLR